METLTSSNGTGTATADELETISPTENVTPDAPAVPAVPPLAAYNAPDDHAANMIRVTDYAYNIFSPPFIPAKDADGKVARNADGAARLSTETYTKKAVQGMIARTLHALPEHRAVTVTWTHGGQPFTFTMRKETTTPAPDKDARNMRVTFGVKQSDGTYKPWNLLVRNITGIAGQK